MVVGSITGRWRRHTWEPLYPEVQPRLAMRDDAARVISCDEVVTEGGNLAAAQLKSQVAQFKVDPAGAGGCVAKFAVEYETVDDTPLSPVDEGNLIGCYLGLVKKMEENILARPGDFAA
ncbi:unnamed protein product [Urochloa humidicola]